MHSTVGSLYLSYIYIYIIYIYNILNLSWRDHVTNMELYGCIPPLSSTIHQRRMRFAGHCFRSADQPVSKLIFWSPTGKRSRGRVLKIYTKMLAEDTGLNSENEVKNLMWRGKDNYGARVLEMS